MPIWVHSKYRRWMYALCEFEVSCGVLSIHRAVRSPTVVARGTSQYQVEAIQRIAVITSLANPNRRTIQHQLAYCIDTRKVITYYDHWNGVTILAILSLILERSQLYSHVSLEDRLLTNAEKFYYLISPTENKVSPFESTERSERSASESTNLAPMRGW